MLTDEKVLELQQTANTLRKDIIEMLLEAGSGHTAGPLGMADVFTLLYFNTLKHDPKNPDWEERDRLVLSNGHICPVQYAAMARSGYFPVEELKTLRKLHSRLQGHPHREYLPGIEASSGPLGSGLGQAVGIALAQRMNSGRSTESYIYALMGDGELDCGIIWESAMLAGREKLQNLIGIVDRNGIQIDGYTWDVMPLEPLKDKWESFGWHVIEVDGHNFTALNDAIGEAKAVNDKPSVLIVHTIPGKGVKEFERDYHWHGKPPSKEEGDMALKELRTLGDRIVCHDCD
ncbi:MAG: transketolase [Parcubacteria group bacterium]|mgnify:FL=1|jgi:transketolase|nr:transketolase [Parcubacteria group bacterium]|tara:strand:+ start:6078 stop:6944 length:867 start_codon:yes stop_codon:yes gene_type:complete